MSSQDNETGRLASNISSPKFRPLGSTKASKCVREMKDADAGMAWGSWTPHSVQTIKAATKTRLQGSRMDSCGTHQVRDSYKNIVWSPANYAQSYGRITSGSAELTIMAGGSSRQCMRGLPAYTLKHYTPSLRDHTMISNAPKSEDDCECEQSIRPVVDPYKSSAEDRIFPYL
jgi:hypothetical protein